MILVQNVLSMIAVKRDRRDRNSFYPPALSDAKDLVSLFKIKFLMDLSSTRVDDIGNGCISRVYSRHIW